MAQVKPTDGPVSRYVNRRLSWPITMLIVRLRLPLTPNAVSLISFATALLAALLLATGNGVAGGILVQVSSVLDGVDGELARVTGRTSRRGGFLDAMLDRYADVAVLGGLAAMALAAGYEPAHVLALALAAVTGDLLVSYVHARGEASLGVHPALVGRVPQLASRDVRLFIVFIGALIGRPAETLAVIAALTHAYVAAKTVDAFTAVRE